MGLAYILPFGCEELAYTEVDWSCEEETIKRNFQRDVLSLIEKGIRYVGLDKGEGCANCYMYRDICASHEETDFVGFDHIKKDCTLTVIMPRLNFFEFKKITGDGYVKIYQHWREIIYTFSNNQNY
jgi:hypothetical protein